MFKNFTFHYTRVLNFVLALRNERRTIRFCLGGLRLRGISNKDDFQELKGGEGLFFHDFGQQEDTREPSFV